MWYKFSLQLACLKRQKVQRTIIKSGSFETYSCETVKDVSASWHWQISRSDVNPSRSHAASMLLAGCRQWEGVTLMTEWDLSLCVTTEITGAVCPGISAFSSFVRGESFSFKWRHFTSSVCTLTCFSRVQLFATPETEPTRLFAPEIPQLRALEWIATFLQGMFPTQRWNAHLLRPLHWRQILYHWVTREALYALYQKATFCSTELNVLRSLEERSNLWKWSKEWWAHFWLGDSEGVWDAREYAVWSSEERPGIDSFDCHQI